MAGLDPAIYRGTAPGYYPRHGAGKDGRSSPAMTVGTGGAGTSNILRVGITTSLPEIFARVTILIRKQNDSVGVLFRYDRRRAQQTKLAPPCRACDIRCKGDHVERSK
jgi:hypothetical protein